LKAALRKQLSWASLRSCSFERFVEKLIDMRQCG
jgi:hypothetical protein